VFAENAPLAARYLPPPFSAPTNAPHALHHSPASQQFLLSPHSHSMLHSFSLSSLILYLAHAAAGAPHAALRAACANTRCARASLRAARRGSALQSPLISLHRWHGISMLHIRKEAREAPFLVAARARTRRARFNGGSHIALSQQHLNNLLAACATHTLHCCAARERATLTLLLPFFCRAA